MLRRCSFVPGVLCLLLFGVGSVSAGPTYTVTDLGTLGGFDTYAYGINNSGQVAGMLYNNHAFFWSSSTGMQDIGALPSTRASYSMGYDINDNSQVVGQSTDSAGNYHPFLWSSDTGMQDLGNLPGGRGSGAIGINAYGVVVGSGYNSDDSSRAFLWSSVNGLQDLNGLIPTGSGWSLQYATAINDNGWIIGSGVNPRGQKHAFLLTPIPEPSTFALLGAGAIGLVAFAWRWKRRAA